MSPSSALLLHLGENGLTPLSPPAALVAGISGARLHNGHWCVGLQGLEIKRGLDGVGPVLAMWVDRRCLEVSVCACSWMCVCVCLLGVMC